MATPAQPIGLVAPWWRDYNKAVADGKVTKTEVKKLIETHKDLFDDKNYRQALDALLVNEGPKDIRLTRGAQKELKAALKKDEPHIWWPSHDQLTKTYGSIARSAMESGSAVRLEKAPEGYQNAPVYNITPAGMADNDQKVYLVGGKLYLAQTGFTGLTHWFDCGPAPLF